MGRIKRDSGGKTEKNSTVEDRATATSYKALTDEVNDLRKTVQTLNNENKELKNKLAKANEKYEDAIRHTAFGPLKPSAQTTQINKQQHKFTVEIHLLTVAELLSVALIYCGFDASRQQRVNLDRRIRWFKSFFGAPPTTLCPMMTDLKDETPELVYKDCLMAYNWLYLYDTREVLCGRWGRNENDIG